MNKMMKYLLASVLVLGSQGIDIDPMKHDVVKVTASNFDSVVSKHRDWQVSAVLYYTENRKCQSYFDSHYNPVAKDLKRMVKVAALNCDDFPVFCKSEKVDKYPTVVVYPRLPIPAYPIPEGEKMEKQKLSNHLSKQIPSENVKMIAGADSKAELDKFIVVDDSIPKVILVHEKKNVAPLFKAMANEFRKDMTFAAVTAFGDNREHGEAALKRFKGKKYPSIFLVEKGGQKTSLYKGKMDYTSISEWVNLRRETFAKGGGFDETATGASGSSAPKPWLVEEVPEMTKASHNDICLKKEGLCVIYLKDSAITAEDISMLTGLRDKYTSQLDGRGVVLKWMWMNVTVETNYKTLFGVEETPSVVVFNPHKRLRFAKNDDDGGSAADVTKLLEKVLGGDARFKMVKGQKLPAFAKREDAAAREEL